MKKEWSDYLNEIEVAERIKEIIERRIAEVSSIFDVEIQRFFVSNIRKEEKEEFTSLWLLTDDRVFECKSFISKEDYDILVYKGKVSYVNITKLNFSDFDNPTNVSSLKVVCYLDASNLSCSFNAVGLNTKYLLALIKDTFLRNVV